MPLVGPQLEGQLLSFEGDRLVGLEHVGGSPFEGHVNFPVIVRAVHSEEVVVLDNDDGDEVACLVVLYEDHLVEGVLPVPEVTQPLDDSQGPRPRLIAEAIDIGAHQVKGSLPTRSQGCHSITGSGCEREASLKPTPPSS